MRSDDLGHLMIAYRYLNAFANATKYFKRPDFSSSVGTVFELQQRLTNSADLALAKICGAASWLNSPIDADAQKAYTMLVSLVNRYVQDTSTSGFSMNIDSS